MVFMLITNNFKSRSFCVVQNNVTPYNEMDDYQLTDNIIHRQTLSLTPNMFAIFMPYEPHKPGIAQTNEASTLKKVVIKLDVAALTH